MNFKRLLFIPFLFSALPAACLPDSLHVQFWGGAQISDQEAAGLKANESGILDAWMTHCFTDAVFCAVYLQCSPSFQTPFIEEASLGYRKGTFSARGGMLSTRFGRAVLYKPFSVYNPFTRTSVIWDSYGFGFSLDSRVGPIGLAGAATINTRENGAAHICLTVLDNSTMADRLLLGFQTGDVDNQDNDVVVGNDLRCSFRPLDFHVAARYTSYQGYGNPTIKPGRDAEILGEAKIRPLDAFDLSAMVYYKDFAKSYSFCSTHVGLDAQYLMLRWLGIYGGYELLQDGATQTHVPQIGVAFVPVADHSLFRLGIESSIVGSTDLNRLTGLAWFEF